MTRTGSSDVPRLRPCVAHTLAVAATLLATHLGCTSDNGPRATADRAEPLDLPVSAAPRPHGSGVLPPDAPLAPPGTSRPSAVAGRGQAGFWLGDFPLTGDFLRHGAEDLIGLMRDSMATRAYLVAIDGRSFEPAWTIAVGAYEGAISTPVAVVGRNVAWSGADGVVRVHDAASGAEVRRITLDDDVRALCVHDGKSGWLVAVGGHDTRYALDPASGAREDDHGTTTCEPRRSPSFGPSYVEHGAEAFVAPSGYAPAGLPPVRAADLVLQAVTKHPGFPTPALLAFDATSKGLRWATAVAAPGPSPPGWLALLSGEGQAVGLVSLRQPAVGLVAVDLRSGDVLWKTPVPCEGRAMFLSPTRAFVMGMVQLHVFDRTSGAWLHTIGDDAPQFCH